MCNKCFKIVIKAVWKTGHCADLIINTGMKLTLLIFLLITFCLLITDVVDCKKKKKKSIFKKRRHHKKKAAPKYQFVRPSPAILVKQPAIVSKTSTIITTKPATVSTKLAIISATKTTKASAVKSIVSSASIKAKAATKILPSVTPVYYQSYHKKDNLKLVFQTVMPAGIKRPKENFVFQYTDEEEGKSCRCICRTK